MKIKIRTSIVKDDIDKIVVLLWLLFLTVNIFSNLITDLLGGIGNISLTYVFLMYFVFEYGDKNSTKIKLHSFLLFILIYIFEIQFIWETESIYYSMGIPFKTDIWNFISFVPHTIAAICVLTRSKYSQRVWISKLLKIILMIISIATVNALIIDPNVVRVSATGSQEDIPFIANFGIIYGSSIILSYLLVKISNKVEKRIIKLINSFIFILFLICIFNSAYSIAISAALIGIVCCFILKIKRNYIKYFLVTAVVIVVLLAYLGGTIESILMYLAEFVPISAVSQRLEEMSIFLGTGKFMETTGRLKLYKSAIELIFRHPITGNIVWNFDVVLSGHSTTLDIIGGCGLLIFIPFVKFISEITKYQLKMFNDYRMQSAIVATTIAFWLVATLNPIFASPVVMVFYIIGPFMGESIRKEMEK